MKVIIFQENLSKKVSFLSRALPTKTPAISSLNNFLFSAKENEIRIFASNLDTTIVSTATGKVFQEGEVLINAKTLISFLSSLAGEKIVIEGDEKKVKIEGGKTKIVLKTENPNDFPVPEEKDLEGGKTTPKGLFEEAMKKVCFAASTDEARGALTGVFFEPEEKGLNVVATDGFRLSLLQKKEKSPAFSSSLIIPAKTVFDICSIAQEEGVEDINIKIIGGGKQIVFSTKETKLYSRLVEGDFPNYKKIIPENKGIKITFNRDELLRAVKIASIFAKDGANIVKLQTGESGLFLYASSPQTGENQTQLEAKIEGEKDLNIAFNFRFLLDFLNSSEEEEVLLQTTGPLSPGVFRSVKKERKAHTSIIAQSGPLPKAGREEDQERAIKQ
ncbi:MAG: polymerase III subunit beta protein [Candidatus Levybacteria bacterium GW2011_GWA2_40_8]|nr:MAG: polymerase III subunit beta protein [Candidatus Levybacteria bacterium GW2011_GWA2_40_8]